MEEEEEEEEEEAELIIANTNHAPICSANTNWQRLLNLSQLTSFKQRNDQMIKTSTPASIIQANQTNKTKIVINPSQRPSQRPSLVHLPPEKE